MSRDVPVQPPATGLTRRVPGALTRPQLRGTVYLLLDHSASMSDEGKMEGLVRAELLMRASCNAARFKSQLLTLEPAGRTAMTQAIQLATRQLKQQPGDRIILLVTDGMSDNREATLYAARLARAQGITLIAIGIGHTDEAFLAALTPRPELAAKVEPEQLEKTLGHVIKALPRSQ